MKRRLIFFRGGELVRREEGNDQNLYLRWIAEGLRGKKGGFKFRVR